ncbi:MAG: hypothetical protein C0399_06925 [Syntrophus sp. (in: bacteria)]|nr:hypothetical protein [Syntrophus sp. (in: bacteria)]
MINGYTTVSSLLESLNVTEEEFELHKELIEECRENERNIIEYSSLTRQNIEKISFALSGMYQMMTALTEASNHLFTETERLSLRMMPADMFYRE